MSRNETDTKSFLGSHQLLLVVRHTPPSLDLPDFGPVHPKHRESIGWLDGVLWHRREKPRLGEAEYVAVPYVPIDNKLDDMRAKILFQRLNISQQDTGQGRMVCNHSQAVLHSGLFLQCFFPLQFCRGPSPLLRPVSRRISFSQV